MGRGNFFIQQKPDAEWGNGIFHPSETVKMPQQKAKFPASHRRSGSLLAGRGGVDPPVCAGFAVQLVGAPRNASDCRFAAQEKNPTGGNAAGMVVRVP